MKLFHNIKRNLERLDVSARFYYLWFFFVVFVVMVFGAIPLIKVLVDKKNTLSEMNLITENLADKHYSLLVAKDQLVEFTEELSYLGKFIPEDADIEDYMADVVSKIIEEGFSVSFFKSHVSVDPDGILVRIRIDGIGSVPRIITLVEDMGRIVQIEEINVLRVKSRQQVDLIIKVMNVT